MVVAVAGIVLAQKSAQPAPVSGTATTTGTGLTMADIATHGTRDNCWTAINGGVYDLTSWIPQHPGGEQGILALCGTDGSARFNGQHGGSATQLNILAGFKVGDLGGTPGATGAAATAPAPAVTGDDNDGSGRNRRGRDTDLEDDAR